MCKLAFSAGALTLAGCGGPGPDDVAVLAGEGSPGPTGSQLLAAAVDPAVVGQWSAGFPVPVEAVHAALLPTGKVVMYDTLGGVQLWNPSTQTFSASNRASYETFCSGLALMADGKLFVAGGRNNISASGAWNASLFDPISQAWTILPDMNAGRWYPTALELGNGDMLALSGSITSGVENAMPQVWSVQSDSWRDLSSVSLVTSTYPRAHLAPNGKVFVGPPDRQSRYLDTTGTGAVTNVAKLAAAPRGLGSSVQYDDGKILVAGGGRVSQTPLASAEIINLNAPVPIWTTIAPMANARMNSNATLLPDGKVLVTGGSSLGGVNNPAGAVLPIEQWDPATQTWTTLASLSTYRGYHSTAMLLPDGRVFSAGGSQLPPASVSLSGEIYSPPYLFKGPRPVVTSAPTSVAYGETFHVTTPNGAAVAQVAWISLPTVTHAFNMSQRRNVLAFAPSAGGIDVTAPSDPNRCVPGYKMLFLLTADGVPSVAPIVRIGSAEGSSPNVPGPAPALTGAPAAGKARLDWTAAPANATGFKIERAMSLKTGIWSRLVTVAANTTTFMDSSVGPATTYHYRIRSYNAEGTSPYSSTIAVAMP